MKWRDEDGGVEERHDEVYGSWHGAEGVISEAHGLGVGTTQQRMPHTEPCYREGRGRSMGGGRGIVPAALNNQMRLDAVV